MVGTLAVVGVLDGASVGVLVEVGVVGVVAPARPAMPNVTAPANAAPAMTLRTIW